VTLVTLTDRDEGEHTFWGDGLALFSACCYGAYCSLLKYKIRDENQVNMPMFFGYVGLFNMLILWPVIIVLHYTGIEPFELPSLQIVLYLTINGLIGTVVSGMYRERKFRIFSPISIFLVVLFFTACEKEKKNANGIDDAVLFRFTMVVINLLHIGFGWHAGIVADGSAGHHRGSRSAKERVQNIVCYWWRTSYLRVSRRQLSPSSCISCFYFYRFFFSNLSRCSLGLQDSSFRL
jgi:hypothetical protein